MPENQANQNLGKYLQDIKTIKDLLAEVDRRPLFEPWIFYAWGAVMALGSLTHFVLEKRLAFSVGEIFLKVWLPAILVGGFIEALSLSRTMARHSLSIFSRGVVKLYASLVGTFSALIFIVLLFIQLDAMQQMPVVMLLVGAIFYFILAQQSAYVYLFAHGFILVLLAIVLYLFEVEHHALTLIVGCTFAASLAIAGFNAARMEKSN